MRGDIMPGDSFRAIIRESEHSRTLSGEERKGKDCGVYIAEEVNSAGTVISGERIFRRDLWILDKIEKRVI